MRKISIKAISLVLSVLLIFSAFGGALSVFAENAAEDIYGTSANGIQTNGGAVRNIDPTDAPKNLDFKEGFKYWSSKADKNGYASDMLVLDTDEDGTTYVRTIKASDVVTDGEGNSNYTLDDWMGLETAPFKISAGYEGKDIYLITKYKRTQAAVDAGKSSDLGIGMWYTVTTVNEDETVSVDYKKYSYGDLGGSNHTAADAYNTRAINTGVKVSSTEKYSIEVQDSSGPLTAGAFKDEEYTRIASITLAVMNDDGSFTDLSNGNRIYMNGMPYGGTAEDGISAMYFSDRIHPLVTADEYYPAVNVIVPTVGLKNADFSEGFKFWGPRIYDPKIPEVMSISEQASVSNGAVTFKPVSKEGVTLYPGISSSLFTLPGIKAGDKLIATVEARNGYISFLMLKEWTTNQYNNTSGVNIARVDNANDDSASWRTVSTAALTVNYESPLFSVTLQRPQGASTEIRNFRIYKVLDDGGYVDVTNGYDESAVSVNANGGSEKDGLLELNMSMTSSVSYNNPYSTMVNGDFSEGLKYWSVKTDKTGYASTVAAATADGALVTLGRYEGLKSPTVQVPADLAGKQLVARYGYNGLTNGSAELRLYVNGTRIATAYPNGDMNDALAFKDNNVILNEGDKITLEIQGGTTNGAQYLIKYVDLAVVDESGMAYTSFDGKTVYAYDGLNPAAILGGTEENGLYANNNSEDIRYTAKNSYILPEYRNGDFSEGFRYWTLKYNGTVANDRYLSQEAEVDKTAGIVTFKEVRLDDGSENVVYAGMRSQGFYVTNKGLKSSDIVYAAADVRATPETGSTLVIGLRAYDSVSDAMLGTNTNYGEHFANTDTENWKTAYSAGITTDGKDIAFFMYLQRYYNEGGTQLKNIRLVRDDRGGLANTPKVNIDGTLDTAAGQLYGDANNDGAVNILDLVRIKKYAAGSAPNGIFLAAADIDGNDAIDASDLTEVAKAVIDAEYVIKK